MVPENSDNSLPLMSHAQNESEDRSLLHSVHSNDIAPICLTFAVGIGSLLFGFHVGFSSPVEFAVLNQVFNQNKALLDLAWSLLNIGCIIGSLFCGPIALMLGRKKTIILSFIPFTLGTMLMNFAVTASVFIIGRLVVGFAVGLSSVIVPLYIAEIAPTHLRGTLGCFNQLLIGSGIALVNILGLPLVTRAHFWHSMLLFSLIFVSIQLISVVIFATESPRWLLMNDKIDMARKTLLFLRGPEYAADIEITETLQHIAMLKNSSGGQRQRSFIEAIQLKQFRTPFCIGIGLMILQQFSGINAVIFHTMQLFQDKDTTSITYKALRGAIFVNSVQVIATLFASMMIERVGRRIFLMGSCVGMGICSISMAICTYASTSIESKIVAMIGYIVSFAMGVGPLPWLLTSEILPLSIRAVGISLATVMNWLCSFLITLLFNPMTALMGPAGLFVFYGSICFIGSVFVLYWVPETRGKTLEEIEEIFMSDESRIFLP